MSKVANYQHLLSSSSLTSTTKYIKQSHKSNITYYYVEPGFFDIIYWSPIAIGFIITHLFGFYGLYLLFSFQIKWTCVLAILFQGSWTAFGITAGAHRLWVHRSYKAKGPLKIFLLIGHTMSYQFSTLQWSIYHVIHHKHSDTDADIHNIKRGSLFAHVGHVFKRTHPAVYDKGSSLDISFLLKDKYLVFQDKYYYLILIIATVIYPHILYRRILGETNLLTNLALNMLTVMLTLHSTFSVNSYAHIFGTKKYNSNIFAGDSHLNSLASYGEGYHNYHHTFPSDYATSEYGEDTQYNWAKIFIDFMNIIGQAYDLKRAPKDLIRKVKLDVNNNN